MNKIIITLLFACISVSYGQQIADAGEDAAAFIDPNTGVFNHYMPCGHRRYDWIFSCQTTTGKWVKILPLKVSFADCRSPGCPWYRRCFASEVTALQAQASADATISAIPIKYWGYRCVPSAYYIQDAFIADCTQYRMVQCRIPRYCDCRCWWPLPWDHLSYIPEREAVYDAFP